MKSTLLALSICIALGACSSQQLADFNQAMKPKPAAQPTGTTGAPRAFEQTAEQRAAMKEHMATRITDAQIVQARTEANEYIERAVAGLACLAKHQQASFLTSMAAPSSHAGSTGSPRTELQYDTGGQCLDITRIDGWSMQARNALSFRSVFTSKASGESTQRIFQMVKQPEGVWLFTNVMR